MSTGNMERILRLMAEKGASDVYLSANTPVLMKLNGAMVQVSDQVLTPGQPKQLIGEVVKPEQLEELDQTGELNMAVAVPKVGSFRLSGFRQRGSIAGVFRHIPHHIPSLEDLHLPPVLGRLVQEKRGLILMVGATGTGKSTTLAAMLETRNKNMTGHILTIEDPLEYLFSNKRSIVNQREVGRDTASLQIALKNALRQAPDCILIGEIRDRETMTAAISYALSGHLVLATMHGNNTYHALNRILSLYPPDARPALLNDLAAGLKAIVSQRLVKAIAGGRVPVIEILLNTKLVGDLIERGDIPGVKEAMEKSIAEGSQSYEEHFAELITEGTITREEGLAFADSPTNLLWRLQNDGPGALKPGAPPPEEAASDEASFTEITLDVRTE
ncbi:MAG: PilT/PilU family type 4a pilus ATPase [Paucibacter sp.]|nr:PilT/PilU family type 4a pilus ATPase [Roseateles sp.]